MSSHGKTVCSCGAVIMQCRCMEGHHNVTTLQNACAKCRSTPAPPLPPITEAPRPADTEDDGWTTQHPKVR